MKPEFFRHIFEKNSHIKFNENLSSGSRFVSCGRTDRRTDMAKLIVAFRSFAEAPKSYRHRERERERERESRCHCASAAGSMATSSAERHSEGKGVVVEWR
jgi:hypothetical protein